MRSVFRAAALALLAAGCFDPAAHAAEGGGQPARVTLLPDQSYYTSLSSAIRRARKEIKGCFFLFKATAGRGNLPMELVEELIAARRRGVVVSLELEQDLQGNGSVTKQNRRAASLLREAGVKVRFDSPGKTTHVKAVEIDGRFVYLGSHNLTQSALKYNNELSVLVDSSDFAKEVADYLDRL